MINITTIIIHTITLKREKEEEERTMMKRRRRKGRRIRRRKKKKKTQTTTKKNIYYYTSLYNKWLVTNMYFILSIDPRLSAHRSHKVDR